MRDVHAIDESRSRGIAIQREAIPELVIPDFVRRLKQYQRVSVKHMIDIPYSANFSVPGSGKTTIVYAAFSVLRERGEVDRLLVIGPRSCFRPWEEEFEGCFGRVPRRLRITGPPEYRVSLLHTMQDIESSTW